MLEPSILIDPLTFAYFFVSIVDVEVEAPAPCLPPVFFHFNPPPAMEHLYSIPLASYATLFRELHFQRFVTGPSTSLARAGALIRESASPVAVNIARIRFFENI